MTFHWTQLQNIMRDPFENNVGAEQKGAFSMAGALASPSTAYIYDWNLLPIGQLLWEKELMSYIDFPPLQLAASYNLEQVLEQVQEMSQRPPEPIVDRHPRIDNDGGRLARAARFASANRHSQLRSEKNHENKKSDTVQTCRWSQ